ncbi:hypothetical protein CF327_g5887 [Tilletia walkeri]|uniref:Uncharacterized protein n=1 Tax=Tilletia walkeri TaxID=117179 RepID=A0A8X7N8D6_9BASI|nr:hypothetical protein CF327_g5887 [Tilletia walkeri]KAE8267510.1 hypothetical protein A4X09_0g4839 [Tilletia walkeri]
MTSEDFVTALSGSLYITSATNRGIDTDSVQLANTSLTVGHGQDITAPGPQHVYASFRYPVAASSLKAGVTIFDAQGVAYATDTLVVSTQQCGPHRLSSYYDSKPPITVRLAAGVAGAVVVLLLVFGCIIYNRRKSKKTNSSDHLEAGTTEPCGEHATESALPCHQHASSVSATGLKTSAAIDSEASAAQAWTTTVPTTFSTPQTEGPSSPFSQKSDSWISKGTNTVKGWGQQELGTPGTGNASPLNVPGWNVEDASMQPEILTPSDSLPANHVQDSGAQDTGTAKFPTDISKPPHTSNVHGWAVSSDHRSSHHELPSAMAADPVSEISGPAPPLPAPM